MGCTFAPNTSKTMSSLQISLLKEFKDKVSDILTPHHTDAILLRFLRARNFNLKNAEINLRQVEEAKTAFSIHTIVDTYEKPEVLEKYESNNLLGFAKDGTPIRYVYGGNLDLQGFVLSVTCFDFCSYFCHVMEYDMALLWKESKKAGQEINEMTYIFDIEGCSFQQIAYKSVIETGLDFFRIMQDYYPDLWRRILFINAPYLFGKAFAIFKPILKAGVLEKIQMISKDSTPDVLLQYIDEDVLPAFLGGKRVDSKGNPKCAEFIKFGGQIPDDYYLRNRIPALNPSDTSCTSVVVGPRSVFNHFMVFKEVGRKFELHFQSENSSITTSLLFKHFGPDHENPDFPATNEMLNENDETSGIHLLSPIFRTQSHITPQMIAAKILYPGIYICRIDNRSSWVSSRRVILKAVLLPEQK